MFDVFPIQEGINSLYSTIMTNQNAFGVQNLFVPRDSDIAIASLQAGMNIIEGNSKPEPINFTQTPGEVFKFLEMLIQTAETISGVNSVARGNPEASLKSGTALALVQSMSLQFMSGLQQSYVKMIEDVGTALITMLKDFAVTPKVVALVGKNNRPLLKEFTGEEISSINRVVVDVGNPLSKTIAGRVQMAEQMLQMNMFKNPQEYLQVINTGRLDAMFEGEMNELFLIRSENERLPVRRWGQPQFLHN
jgi:carbon monoxide dehydrogenase subunit G